jgi:tRNA nucleotidyltransferase (CCA-adding enzyme)
MEVITTHINADFDSLASMLAAKKLYPKAVLVFPGSQERNLREFLLQSTIYIFDPQRVKNIDLDKITRLILVDTRQKSRIGKFADILEKPGLEIHIYDHHAKSSGDISGLIEEVKEVGATMTIMAQLLKEKGIEISSDEATVMLLGIYEDTGSFTFSSTREEDYLAAAYLLHKGANLNIISDILVRELTSEQIGLLNELIHTATTYNINGIEIVIAQTSVDKFVGDLAVLVHKLRDIKNINVLFVLARMEDRIYLVARSRIVEVNAGEIALSFGGGGHASAASATIKDLTLTQAKEKLLQLIHKKVRILKVARDIMTFPIKSIESKESLERAGTMMTRYNVNVLPVLEGGLLVGLITRQIIGKASFHGLSNISVKEYMTTNFSVIEPETSLESVQSLIVENNQRFLPVVKGGKLIGGITRTDLLRSLYPKAPEGTDHPYDTGYEPRYARKKNILGLLKEGTSKNILQLFKKLGEVADKLNYNAYAVGGFVRDLLLRNGNLDIDIVIEGDGINFAKIFAAGQGVKARLYKRFGTATIVFPDGLKIDVATARLEYYDHPAALPIVELSSLKQDLYRRDFTMNTLALSLNPGEFGVLIDFFGGQKDIKEKTIRVLHNLSFVEDPTRVFRAIRFEKKLGFKLGIQTRKLIENAVKINFFERLAGSRLASELILILEEEPLKGVARMNEFGILKFIHPRIEFNDEIKSTFENIEDVLSWFKLLFLEEKCKKWLIYFFGLIDPLAEEAVSEVCQRLSFNKKDTRKILEEKRAAKEILTRFSQQKRLKNGAISEWLNPLSMEVLLYMMAKSTRDFTKKKISQYITKLRPRELKGI